MASNNNLKTQFEAANQAHVFKFEHTLTEEEKSALYRDLQNIDLPELHASYIRTKEHLESPAAKAKDTLAPFPTIFSQKDKDATIKKREWEQVGYELIGQGKLAMLLLAGGQGTRLGDPNPKGMYDIGLPSGKSLFQLQAEKLRRAATVAGTVTGNTSVHIPWYIMTSDATDAPTKRFFEKHNFFGLPAEDVFFFQQDMLPCITPEGKIIMESAKKVSRAPNGNGGLYSALKSSGALDDMQKRGVEYVYQYCVDNSLIKMADPTFLGYCVSERADCGVKVVPKAFPEEPVGVLCLRNGKPGVIEYSEIDKDLAAQRTSSGDLVYNASHVCMNLYTVSFLRKIADTKLQTLPFHIANKKIPSVDENGKTHTPSKPNGWKLEMFIFDVFECAERLVAFEVNRNEEFSPLKNAPGTLQDSPETCRQDVSELHKTWLRNAGAVLPSTDSTNADKDSTLCEVSPLLAFSGEDVKDLEKLVRGKTLTLPLEITPSISL